MITPNPSEIVGLSLRSIINCCTNAGTLSGRSQLSETGNQLYTCSHSVCSGYTDIQWQFLLVKIGEKSDLGTEITIPLDKQGCSSLDRTVQLLVSLGERTGPAASPRVSVASRREGIQSSCCTNEKMAPASHWNMSWWHETAAPAAFCPIIHQHLPPTELVKGCLRLFVVLQEVSSRMLLLHSRLGFLSHLASAMSSERRFHLQALCHEGRKLPATSVLCRDDDTACLHACSLTVCCAFVAHTEKAYRLPLPSENNHEKNNSLFLPWICCSWVLTWIQIGIFTGSTLG